MAIVRWVPRRDDQVGFCPAHQRKADQRRCGEDAQPADASPIRGGLQGPPAGNNHGVISAHKAVALVAEQPALVIACDGSATSAGTYQSDTVHDSAEDAQPPTPRQVAREFVRESTR